MLKVMNPSESLNSSCLTKLLTTYHKRSLLKTLILNVEVNPVYLLEKPHEPMDGFFETIRK